ncbi:MAG: T9SS type A sorting domain-containing protein [Flavobacteriales bacterium]|nr:T9SS type A sorting domain-containing protein [Flavobacteriales bacterium]
MYTVRSFPFIMDRSHRNDRYWHAFIWICISLGMALLFVLATAFTAQAQWPIDPNNPLVLCNHTSEKRNLGIVSDGNGGWITLWTDNRITTQKFALYGQRTTHTGALLWEPNGRLIMEVPGRSVNSYGVASMSDGNIFLAYASGADQFGGDTVRAMAIDIDGQPVWAEPTLLAQPGLLPGGGTTGFHGYPRVARVLNGTFVGWGTNPIGAADYVHVARVLNDGTNLMPVQGVEITSLNNSIVTGPWTFRHDLTGGLMLEERWGNGSGAPLYAMRVDSMGNQLWPQLLEVSANSSGLGYEWATAMAPTSRMNSIWANGVDLRMAIYDTTGVLLNNTAPIDVCIEPDVQENPFVRQTDDESIVFWADNRAAAGGGRQVFMQRFDASGNPLLAANGVLAMQVNGNLIGYPRAIAAEDETHIVAMFSGTNLLGGTAGFRVGRVTNTGTNLWSDTTRFCIPSKGPNNGNAYGIVPDGNGGAVAIWYNWEDNAIYTARVDSTGYLGPDGTTVVEEQHAPSALLVYPNPANDRLTIVAGAGTGARAVVELHDATGRLVFAERVNGLRSSHTIDLSAGWADGLYQVVARVDGMAARTARILIQR